MALLAIAALGGSTGCITTFDLLNMASGAFTGLIGGGGGYYTTPVYCDYYYCYY